MVTLEQDDVQVSSTQSKTSDVNEVTPMKSLKVRSSEDEGIRPQAKKPRGRT